MFLLQLRDYQGNILSDNPETQTSFDVSMCAANCLRKNETFFKVYGATFCIIEASSHVCMYDWMFLLS